MLIRIFLRLSPLLLCCVLLSSCKKFLQVAPPDNQIVSSEVFNNDQSAVAAMDGLYSQMMQNNNYFMNGAMSLYAGLSADGLVSTANKSDIIPFYENALLPDNKVLSNDLWRYAYQYIYQANLILENLDHSPAISASTASELKGESHFCRAICYFYLLNLFGPVPLESSSDYRVNQQAARRSRDSVYTLIIDDLQQAKKLLNEDYRGDQRSRPNTWAATALLARVYLFRKDYKQAEAAASEVINSGLYQLDDDPAKVFLPDSKETIWQLVPVSTYFNTAEGYTFIPGSKTVIPPYILSQTLIDDFSYSDRRRAAWIDSNIVEGQVYYYPAKYKVKSGQDKTEYNVVLRLAEQYLIRAEARAQTGDLEGALSNLDKLRARAGLPASTAANKADLLAAILRERQRELFAEWGHRWFDLKRLGLANEVLAKEKNNWRATDSLYPIPQQEINANPSLEQNDGY